MNRAALLAGAAGLAMLALWSTQAQATATDSAPQDSGGDVSGDWLASLSQWVNISAPADTVDAGIEQQGDTEGYVSEMTAEKNLSAFMRAIRLGEGTSGPNGYRTLYGGGLFDSFADHPRKAVRAGAYTSTAAGAYQILSGTWDDFCRANPYSGAGKRPFDPDNQDACCVWLITRRGALADARAGRLADAVRKCAKEWASLPGSPYGQPTVSLAAVQGEYEKNGGMLA